MGYIKATPETKIVTMSQQSKDKNVRQLLDYLQDLFIDQTHADFTITCGNRSWKVHKAIVLRLLYFSSSVEAASKEANTDINILDLSPADPETLKRLLQYLYGADFDELAEACFVSSLIKLYLLAAKYNYPALKNAIVRSVGQAVEEDLVQESWRPEDWNEIVVLYAGTEVGDKFRRELMKGLLDNRASILGWAKDGLRECVGSCPEFAMDLLGA